MVDSIIYLIKYKFLESNKFLRRLLKNLKVGGKMVRKRRILSLLGVFAVILAVFSQSAVGWASASKTCKEVRMPVALTEGKSASYEVYGKLCYRGNPEGKTVQLLVHGFTLSHIYWDFHYQPETYSYVENVTLDGYATLNIDRIGVRNSSHPPATQVTANSHVYVLKQIIDKLRSGQIEGIKFSKVVLVGHSLGSLLSLIEAGKYKNVDGVMITGILHTFDALNVLKFLASQKPAQQDPLLKDYPIGYLTLAKEQRKEFFYNPDNTDPEVYEIDNQTKGTGTIAEFGAFTEGFIPIYAKQIKVPILIVIGEKDRIFCNAIFPCKDANKILKREKLYYSSSAKLEVFVVPNAGHNFNYERTAPQFYNKAKEWLVQNIGQ